MYRRMDWPHLALFCASLLMAGTAYAQRDADKLLGIVSLHALLAGLAGAGLVLSFLPPTVPTLGAKAEIPYLRLFGTIGFCTALGVLGAALAIRMAAKYVPELAGPGAELFAAFALGAIGQVFIPSVIERRGDLLGKLLPKRKEEGT